MSGTVVLESLAFSLSSSATLETPPTPLQCTDHHWDALPWTLWSTHGTEGGQVISFQVSTLLSTKKPKASSLTPKPQFCTGRHE